MIDATTNDPQRAPSSAAARGIRCKPRQAALFETLLPRLALDLDAPRAGRSARAVSARRRRRPARNRLRRRRASDRAGERASAHRLHRHASRSSTAWPRRWSRSTSASSTISACISATPPTCSTGCRTARFARHRSALSRSVAEAAALEAALRPGRKRRATRAHPAAGRRIPLRHRHCRLRRLDAERAAALARFRLDRGAGRRLAPAVAGLFRHALRGQGQARGPRAVLSDFPAEARRCSNKLSASWPGVSLWRSLWGGKRTRCARCGGISPFDPGCVKTRGQF